MVDLKGGTTGQILAKATNADMDFTWIANDQGDITEVAVTSPLTVSAGTGPVATVGILSGTTSNLGAVQLSTSTSSTSTSLAATASAVKSAYDLADGAIAKTTVTTAGDIIYRNATVPARLGIGTAGQVLQVNSGATAPEWATPAGGGGGLVFIKRVAFSAVSSTTTSFDAVFTSAYESYLVVCESIGSSTSSTLHLQTRSSGTTQTSNYYGSSFGYDNVPNLITFGSSNTAQFSVFALESGGFNGAFSLYFESVGNTTEDASWHGTGFSTANTAVFTIGAKQRSSTNVDGFLLKANTGTITGAVSVYGLAKS
jgi:hypothetical protein